jgi:cyanophycinase
LRGKPAGPADDIVDRRFALGGAGFRIVLATLIGLAFSGYALAQTIGPVRGALVLSGAGEPHGDPAVLSRFVGLAGGRDVEILYIPTAASGIRLPSGFTSELPESGGITPSVNALETALAALFGVRRVRILHTRDPAVARSEVFAEPLRNARAVWIGYGNAGRLARLFLGTPLLRELESVLKRGGVIGGNSAGAIIQGSFIVRGRPDKPVLMARGHETGFGFLRRVAINPHLTSAKREGELINVVDQYPDLLGIGLEDTAGLLVIGDTAEVIGSGRAAIYDDARHEGFWYYWLHPGDRFDLQSRRVLSRGQSGTPGRAGPKP